ncbi:TetR-like C-terminal domain-containing protein [Pseudarthrobacter raffinosi]|uniref:TetR-like C-terminal domain-containing protein n=1 Tax=Pseudarthrobacter raffinosi TaxID=2953651 RepID=UPI00208F680D|nr:TetR-like C-terminal domain-containing protein [Pseudarthrobacter sp. MDT3-9]MCO4252057.1 WHG domain-containing protein [Pseudarthrobacter sp. MDT3-9]
MDSVARPVVHNDSLRQGLLAVTADLMDHDGPARVNLRDVAAAAGTSTTAVYSLFGGKSQLLTAVVDDGFRSFRDSQVAAAPGGLRGLGAAYRTWALEHRALYRLMFGGALAAYVDCQPSPDAAADAMEPLMEAVASAQSAGTVLQAPAEMVAVAIWGQVHGLVSLELAQVGPPDADWAAAYSASLDAVARGWAA